MGKPNHKRLLMLVDKGYEDLEVWYPILRLCEEAATVITAAARSGRILGRYASPCQVDGEIDGMDEADFDGLLLPGATSVDDLRANGKVLDLTRRFYRSGKPVAFMDHAAGIAISAGIVRGHLCTSIPALREDLLNAGATWINLPSVVDRNLISTRGPEDLPQFCQRVIEVLYGRPFPYERHCIPSEEEEMELACAAAGYR